jgi:penicillin-binding protein 2
MFYNKRVKIFVVITGLLMLIPIGRLAQLQLFSSPSYLEEIERLLDGDSQQTQTIRGQILDRHGRVIASEEPLFKLYVRYDKITCYADPNVQRAMRLSAQKNKADPGKALAKVNERIRKGLERIAYLLTLCTEFGFSSEEIREKIALENRKIWNGRIFQAWRNNCLTSDLHLEYKDREGAAPGDLARADFIEAFPDENERIFLISSDNYKILEMHSFFPLVELRDDENLWEIINALHDMDMEGAEVAPQAARKYPYKTAASQLIGWVGPATQTSDIETFEHDRLSKYQDGELCGREDGIERVCEPILRGRRGELTYDLDRNLVERKEKSFGQDIKLTIDIELQQEIEDYLITYPHRACCKPGKAAVVLDVQTNEILALVSVPVYDLNTVRSDYGKLQGDKARPLVNRAINEHYPPGSVAKPLVAIAGLESGTFTPQKTVACLSTRPPSGWPRCWIQRQTKIGHNDQWPGQNNARNAIKGSCNVYFSRLAEDIEFRTLQTWFSKFGYGRIVPLTRPLQFAMDSGFDLRTLRQVPGHILTQPGQRRLAGIGQGRMMVTPLQVANSMATLARNGRFMNPSLFRMDTSRTEASNASKDLGISPEVLKVVIDGMNAVVNETGGTAKAAFDEVDFAPYGVRVYGKTGSTEGPENAWFAGFARDKLGRTLAMAVVVEGGQSGSRDGAPLGRDILHICVQHGYLGTL